MSKSSDDRWDTLSRDELCIVKQLLSPRNVRWYKKINYADKFILETETVEYFGIPHNTEHCACKLP